MSTLDDIKKRADEASLGPWFVDSDGVSIYYVFFNDDTPDRDRVAQAGGVNAEFIAHARMDVPKLVAALEAVEARLARYAKLYEGDTDEEKTIQTLCWLVRAEIKEALL